MYNNIIRLENKHEDIIKIRFKKLTKTKSNFSSKSPVTIKT